MALKKINIRVDGVLTQYCAIGKGKPLIVPPAWRADIDRFSEAFEFLGEHYKVYFLNMPGYGNRSVFNRPHTMENYAGFLLKWMNILRLKKADVLGISMGGPIAYHMIKKDANKIIEKSVFLAPWYNLQAVRYPKVFLAALKNMCRMHSSKALIRLFEKIYYNERLTMLIMRLISPKENFRKPAMMRKYVNNLRSFTGKAILESMFHLFETDLGKESDAQKNKAVIIMSKNDRQLDYDLTCRGYKKLFPNLLEIPLTHKFHAPRTWITKKLIRDYFGKAFIEASKI